MTTNTSDFEPQLVGKISEGILGDLDLYLIDLISSVDKVYNERISTNSTTSGVLDEFYFFAPSNSYGLEGTTKVNTLYNFASPKAGDEPIVLYKAHYQYVGKFIEVAKQDDLDLKSSFDDSVSAWFTLPKIPSIMVQQLDKFFRAIDKAQNSEAIVLLTYDFDYKSAPNSEEGWGFAVPEQANNSVHCDYEKTNVVENLSASQQIVGTVHSHPGMAAYASSTDHNDQAGFDGLHITFGWLKSKGDATEYHAELVRGENFYRIGEEKVMDLEGLKAYEVQIGDDVFHVPANQVKTIEAELDISDDQMDQWTSKVTKSNVVTTTNKGWQGHGQGHGSHTGGGIPKAPALNQGNGTYDFLPAKVLGDYPKGIQEFAVTDYPDPTKNTLMIQVRVDAERCYMCEYRWEQTGMMRYVEDRRQCLNCGIFILFGDETPVDVDEHRQANGFTPFEDFINFELPLVVYESTTHDWKAFNFIPKSVSLTKQSIVESLDPKA